MKIFIFFLVSMCCSSAQYIFQYEKKYPMWFYSLLSGKAAVVKVKDLSVTDNQVKSEVSNLPAKNLLVRNYSIVELKVTKILYRPLYFTVPCTILTNAVANKSSINVFFEERPISNQDNQKSNLTGAEFLILEQSDSLGSANLEIKSILSNSDLENVKNVYESLPVYHLTGNGVMSGFRNEYKNR